MKTKFIISLASFIVTLTLLGACSQPKTVSNDEEYIADYIQRSDVSTPLSVQVLNKDESQLTFVFSQPMVGQKMLGKEVLPNVQVTGLTQGEWRWIHPRVLTLKAPVNSPYPKQKIKVKFLKGTESLLGRPLLEDADFDLVLRSKGRDINSTSINHIAPTVTVTTFSDDRVLSNDETFISIDVALDCPDRVRVSDKMTCKIALTNLNTESVSGTLDYSAEHMVRGAVYPNQITLQGEQTWRGTVNFSVAPRGDVKSTRLIATFNYLNRASRDYLDIVIAPQNDTQTVVEQGVLTDEYKTQVGTNEKSRKLNEDVIASIYGPEYVFEGENKNCNFIDAITKVWTGGDIDLNATLQKYAQFESAFDAPLTKVCQNPMLKLMSEVLKDSPSLEQTKNKNNGASFFSEVDVVVESNSIKYLKVNPDEPYDSFILPKDKLLTQVSLDLRRRNLDYSRPTFYLVTQIYSKPFEKFPVDGNVLLTQKMESNDKADHLKQTLFATILKDFKGWVAVPRIFTQGDVSLKNETTGKMCALVFKNEHNAFYDCGTLKVGSYELTRTFTKEFWGQYLIPPTYFIELADFNRVGSSGRMVYVAETPSSQKR